MTLTQKVNYVVAAVLSVFSVLTLIFKNNFFSEELIEYSVALSIIGIVLALTPLLSIIISNVFGLLKVSPHIVTTYYIIIILTYYLGVLLGFSENLFWYDALVGVVFGFLIGLITLHFITRREGYSSFHPLIIAIFVLVVPIGFLAVYEVFEFILQDALGVDLQAASPCTAEQIKDNIICIDEATGLVNGETFNSNLMFDTMFDMLISFGGVVLLWIHLFIYNKGITERNILDYYIVE